MNYKLVANFSQAQAMKARVGQSAAATDGACHNFTLNWLNLMFGGGNFTTAGATARMQNLTARRGGSNPILQKIFVQRWAEGGQSYLVADRMMISMRGLKEKEVLIGYTAYNQTTLVNCIKRPSHAGFCYSFWFNGTAVGAPNGAHTIGFFRPVEGRRGKVTPTGDSVAVFDPNFGEFHLPAIEFNYWFNKFKPFYGNFTYQMMKGISK